MFGWEGKEECVCVCVREREREKINSLDYSLSQSTMSSHDQLSKVGMSADWGWSNDSALFCNFKTNIQISKVFLFMLVLLRTAAIVILPLKKVFSWSRVKC